MTCHPWRSPSLEQGANHPLARSIVERAQALALTVIEQFSILRGLGVSEGRG
ncbi:hypothetical protein [Brenneria tiliae]|uniref:Uncharacterized protein n=1 Tax=Brenneria tiliae TaxID=2914984 RepID=A0ABT0MUQ5_9GAMM|nr:hypothetical protein [Brenneria tiliae]MCL2893327.1 hypothetical protein [Brenneria tiliae]